MYDFFTGEGIRPLLHIIAHHGACQLRLSQRRKMGVDIAHHLLQIKSDIRYLCIPRQTEAINILYHSLHFLFHAVIIHSSRCPFNSFVKFF